MRKAKLFTILIVTTLVMAGCNKEGNAVVDAERATNLEEAADESEEIAKEPKTVSTDASAKEDVKEPKEDDSKKDDSKQNDTILPEFDIISESYMIEGNNGTYIVGRMQGEYLQPTDETSENYPKLCDSIEEFNQLVRNECDGVLPDFTEDARDYYSKQLKDNPGEEYFDGLRYLYYLNVLRADEKYTSFYVRGDIFLDEDVTYDYYYCYNYDSQTGEAVEADDVIIDEDKFSDAVRTCYKNKYGRELDLDTYDPSVPDSINWCLTPFGINVYFDNDGKGLDASDGMYVNLDFDSHKDAIDYKYKSDCVDYVYPFDENDTISIDIDGDGKANLISVVSKDDGETDDCEEYTVSVDGVVYDDFAQTLFFDCYPYYVHNAEGNFIFTEMTGYEGNWIEIISLENGKPEYVKSVEAKKLGGKREIDEVLYSQYRRPAFTNSSILLDFDFYDLAHGSYIVANESVDDNDSEEEEDMGPTSFEFYEVDDRCYVEYNSNFIYGASEIELMNPKPTKNGEDYTFNVRFHYFSGFSFDGDYHGGGYICDVTVHEDGSITISEGNPFLEGGRIELKPLYDARIHSGILDNSEWNTECVKVEGPWRYQGMTEYDEIYENYLELHDDGTAYYATKKDTYPINLNVGIYSIKEGANKNEYEITFDGEIMGYACMPCDTVTFIYNSEKDTLTPVPSEYEVGGAEVKYWRTEPGDWGYAFGFGPASRTDELLKDWNEYNSY